MLPIQTILHPTDFSPHSEAALLLAGALARDYGARLVLLHVHAPEHGYGEPYLPPPDPVATRRALTGRLARMLPDDPAVRAEHLLAEGDPVWEILRAAGEVKADLIVMGTHGRSGLGRVVLGSVAEDVRSLTDF
jgi:universal stress protein A